MGHGDAEVVAVPYFDFVFQNPRAVSFSLVKVLVQVFDTDMNVLANPIPR
jgi:hypothetical protein